MARASGVLAPPSGRRSSLAKPMPVGEIVEDDEAAPGLADELPVTAAQRLLAPPAILDQPGLAHVGDGVSVDRQRLPAGGDSHPRAARQGEAAWRAHHRNGGSITRGSGTRESSSRQWTRNAASAPAALRIWWIASRSRAR